MNLFGVLDVSASALKAERVRAEVVAANMANAETTQTPEGGPYRRHHVVFSAEGGGSFQQSLAGQMNGAGWMSGNGIGNGSVGMGLPGMSSGGFLNGLTGPLDDAKSAPGGVAVTGVISDTSAPLLRYDPQHPDAGADGYVAYPDINPLTEMVDLMGATRAYGMNASAVQAEKGMLTTSLDLLR